MTLEQAGPIFAVLLPLLGGIDFLVRKLVQVNYNRTVKELHDMLTAAREAVEHAEDERDAAKDTLTELEQVHAATAADLVAATKRGVALDAELCTANAELAELGEAKAALDKKQKTHDNRIRRALQMQGAIWTQPVMADTPEFAPLKERRTPIVSVLNLKGGVGKTTLTAHLAWALSARGYRVLLVDLDLQGSLSSLFIRNDELARLGREERTLLQHYLNPDAEQAHRRLADFAVPVPQLNRHCRLVAASDQLAYAELSQTVRWLLRVGGTAHQWNGRHDGRMILRKALHRKGLYKRFDVVLMDCPPLINLCCANALAASDYVLTPVNPSAKTIERVPPLLHRIQQIQREGVNPDLKPLGVVVNRTGGKALTPRERQLLFNLPAETHAVYGSPIDVFDTTVQQRAAVRDGEEYFAPPDEAHPLRVTFESLAEEFVKRLPKGCRHPDERARKKTPPAPNSVGEPQ